MGQNKLESAPNRTHIITEKEAMEIEKEDSYLLAYRKYMQEDMRMVMRDEFGSPNELQKKVEDMHEQNLPVRIKSKTIYLAPLAGIISLIILLTWGLGHLLQKIF